MQLLQQLNLADSLAKLLKAYTEADTTQFLSYTELEKEQSSLSDISGKPSRWAQHHCL